MINNSIIINNYNKKWEGKLKKVINMIFFSFLFLSFDRKIYFRLVFDEMNHTELGLHD